MAYNQKILSFQNNKNTNWQAIGLCDFPKFYNL